MINYFLCIVWPVIIFGSVLAYRYGKKRWGGIASWLFPAAYLLVVVLALRFLLFGETWWEILLTPYIGL